MAAQNYCSKKKLGRVLKGPFTPGGGFLSRLLPRPSSARRPGFAERRATETPLECD